MRQRLGLGAAGLLAIACYLNTLGHQFVFDDLDIIARNPLVTGPGQDMTRIFTSHYWAHLTDRGDLYRPLTILSYALNHRVHGLSPAGYHLVSILLHALCSSLVVSLAARLGLGLSSALAAGLLFAAHPIHTEAVAAAVGRADLMAAAAVLGGWIIHLSAKTDRPAGASRLIALGVLQAAGLLSKESAIVLIGLMLAGDLWRAGRGEVTWRRAAPAYLVCGAVVLAWLAVRATLVTSIPAGSPYAGPFTGVPAPLRLYTAIAVTGRYLWLLARPLHLSADYSFEQIPLIASPTDPAFLLSAAALAGLVLVAAYRLALRRPPRLDGLCAAVFLAAFAPVSNLLIPIGTIMAERLLYLPSIAFCIALPAIWEIRKRSWPGATRVLWLGPALTGALVTLYAARTIQRNADWRDQLTLFQVTAATSPRSAKVRYNLGVALQDAGREAEALQQYLTAISIKPQDAKSHHNAGLILAKIDDGGGRMAEAASHLELAAGLDPGLPKVHSNLGVAYSRLGRSREAEAAFRAALDRDPVNHDALYNLGTVLLLTGRIAEAVGPLERARDLDPSNTDGRYQLGSAYLEAGRPREAVEQLQQALDQAPDLAEAHLQLARAFLRLGMRSEAAAAASRARAAGLDLPGELRDLREAPR